LVDQQFIPNVADADVYTLATGLAKCATPPLISFDCGVGDELLEHNRAFHTHLETIGRAHHYAEHPGGHNWDTHVQEALRQHAHVLGIA
jgi:putative tributyrin esterase